MKHRFSFVDSELDVAKRYDLYRKMRPSSVTGSHIIIGKKSLLNLCSNDYLGMPATHISTKQMQSSSRLISGNDESYYTLEKILARHKSQQACLVYPTGYMANLGTISALAGKGDLILSDELNHASVIESCRLSGAKIIIYGHNDMKDLAAKIKPKYKKKYIITEGIFSMDGDYAKMQEIAEIAHKNDAITILDDAHGDFAVGHDGKGTPEKLCSKVDVYISSLSKGLGSFGGYVASEKNVINYSINKSKAFIYTSALPSTLVEHAIRRFGYNRERYQKKLAQNTKTLASGLSDAGITIQSKTHIIPIMIGGESDAMKLGAFLYRNGIFAQPIRYPTVPKGMARIRISVTAWLSRNDIKSALSVFERAAKKFNLTC
ncbi:MAG: aminotransferase class I/II-fold pyridoxal phosphate-dependent enzyme [Thaumarchaeota archaeon]|nr:aminotransferase class I/II-fold pyridoxal phosphate-dependent enzyme [Nitrososphaerota archaeon]